MNFVRLEKKGFPAILNSSFFILLGLILSGCFNEPEPAYKTVPAEKRVYLKNKGLTTLTTEDVLKKGQIFVVKTEKKDGEPDHGAQCDGSMTNLSSRVTQLDPASLDYLNLDYNALTNVDALASFAGLKWLRLNENRLSSLPSLSSLTSLRRIYLRDNRFTTVPETLKDLPALTDIDLSGNPIGKIPDWLAQKKGLKGLSFSRTAVSELPKDLSAWKGLKQLQLGELNLSAEEMARIRAALPDVAIVF